MTTPDGTDAADQIRRLFRLGMSADAATAAVEADRVTMALVDHLIGGAREFRRDDAARRAGVDTDIAAQIDRAAGLEDGARYSESDIRHLSLVGRLLQVLPEDRVLAQIRSDTPTLRLLAMRALDTSNAMGLAAHLIQESDPVDAGIRLAEITRPMLDTSTELIGQSYRRAVLQLITSDLMIEAVRSADETVRLAVAFVDVVGYTSLTARIDPRGLDDVLTMFETACQDMVEANTAVTLVKFLGDAGMFVCLDPQVLAHAVLGLVGSDPDGRGDALGEIGISAGIAHGGTLVRGGDYFGEPVNEAARLTDLARRNTVLVSEDLADILDGQFELRRLPAVNLHGIGRRRPLALRPAP